MGTGNQVRTLGRSGLSALLGLVMLSGGCASMDLPTREGSTSDRVIHAYFSKEAPTSKQTVSPVAGGVRMGRRLPGADRLVKGVWLPAPATEFDPERDEQVTFVFVVKPPKDPEQKEFETRITLLSPHGGQATDTDMTKTERNVDRYAAGYTFPMRILKELPGLWTLGAFIDGEPVGTYRFLVGDAATVAKLKESQRKAVESVAGLLAVAQVRLELTGPPGAAVKIEQPGAQPQTGSIDPATGKVTVNLAPGTYVVEVTKPGFEPWRETITLRQEETAVARTVTLKPR